MPKLNGSTKRSEWERRWAHEQPHDWERGRIQVDGDSNMTATKFLSVLAVTLFLWGVIVWAFYGFWS